MSNYAAPHQIADAIESLEWKGCSIGHKVVLANAVAALRATQPAAGEPVYQVMYLGLDGGGWIDVDRETMGRHEAYPKEFRTRTLWTTPPSAAHGDEAVRDKAVLERLRDLYESAYGAGQNNPNGYSSLHDREWEVQDAFRAMRAQGDGEVNQHDD